MDEVQRSAIRSILQDKVNNRKEFCLEQEEYFKMYPDPDSSKYIKNAKDDLLFLKSLVTAIDKDEENNYESFTVR